MNAKYYAAAVALTIACQGTVQAACTDDWLNVEEIRDGDTIEVHASNLQEFPITYSMRVRTRDFDVGGSRTVTRTLDPEETERVMVLTKRPDRDRERYRISCDWTVGDKDAEHDDGHVYLFPYAEGRRYRIIQGYGSSFSHTGLEEFALDFRMDEGTPVHAARGGVVAKLEESNDKGCWEDGCGRYANYVVVLHDDGTTGEYYHLLKDGALVDVGQRVEAGEKIALSGNTGHTTIPHLHFAVYRAVSWGSTQSIPVRFFSDEGIVERPRRWGRYVAVGADGES